MRTTSGLLLSITIVVSTSLGCNDAHRFRVSHHGTFQGHHDPVRFARESLDRLELLRCDLTSSRERSRWSLDEGRASPSGQGLQVEGRRIRLSRQVSLEADHASWVEIQLARPSSGPLSLRWFGADTDEVGLMKLRSGEATSFKGAQYRFMVRGHATWKGMIRRLEVEFGHPRGATWDLVQVRVVGRPLRGAWLAQATQAHRVEIDSEIRTAVPCLSGRPVIIDFPHTPTARTLQLGFGIDPESRGPVSLRGTSMGSSDRSRELFRVDFSHDDADAFPWHQITIENPPRDGPWSLRLEVWFGSEARTKKAAPNVAWWSEPRLVSQGHDATPNILLVVLDTLRADRTTVNDPTLPTMPFLAGWAADNAAVYLRALAPSPWTIPSHTSLFSGRTSIRHGVNHPFYRSPGYAAWEQPSHLPLMAEQLRAAGIQTWATTGGGYLHPRWGFDAGFDRYAFSPSRTQADRELETGVDRVLRWIQEDSEGPWFAFLHTYEIHDPYQARPETWSQVSDLPTPKRIRFAVSAVPRRSPDRYRLHQSWQVRSGHDSRPATRDEVTSLLVPMYDSRVAWADRQLERLLTSDEMASMSRPTMVVVTSDHGQVLAGPGEPGHVDLTEATLHIPLVVSWPDKALAGSRVRRQVELVDILPTILDTAGVPSDGDGDGLDLRTLPWSPGSETRRTTVGSANSTNAGVYVQAEDGSCIVFDDSAWHGTRPRAVSSKEGCTTGPALPVDALDPADRTRLSELMETIRSVAPGVVLTIENNSPQALTMTFKGSSVRAESVKIVHIASPGLDLDPDEDSATAVFPAGSKGVYRIEKIFSRRLHVAIRGPGEVSFSSAVDLLDLRNGAPFSRTLGHQGWTGRGDQLRPNASRVVIEWVGPHRAPDPMGQVSSEIRDQLEALGYVH